MPDEAAFDRLRDQMSTLTTQVAVNKRSIESHDDDLGDVRDDIREVRKDIDMLRDLIANRTNALLWGIAVTALGVLGTIIVQVLVANHAFH